MSHNAVASQPINLALPVGQYHPQLLVHQRPETISNFLRSYGIWQRHLLMFMLSYLREGDIFVDVGANIGYFTIYAGLRVGNTGQIHAIEPAADNAGLLAANLDLNGLSNVEIHRAAISDHCGRGTLFRSAFNSGSHSLIKKETLANGPTVPVVTLDSLLQGTRAPTLIKVDVQGAELQVLRSMEELIKAAKRKPAIIIEFSPVDLARNGHLEEFFGFIAAHGYRLRAFIANERHIVRPPQIRRATLKRIADDLIEANDPAEFDLLLVSHT